MDLESFYSVPHLILCAEQLQLIIDQAVLGALLLTQRTLFLQLGRPESLDAVHGAAQLLIRQLQFAFQIT